MLSCSAFHAGVCGLLCHFPAPTPGSPRLQTSLPSDPQVGAPGSPDFGTTGYKSGLPMTRLLRVDNLLKLLTGLRQRRELKTKTLLAYDKACNSAGFDLGSKSGGRDAQGRYGEGAQSPVGQVRTRRSEGGSELAHHSRSTKLPSLGSVGGTEKCPQRGPHPNTWTL